MKTFEKVLSYVNSQDRATYQYVIDTFFSGSESDFIQNMSFLVEEGLVHMQPTSSGATGSYIYSTDKGLSYFLVKKEQDSDSIKKRLWDVLLVLVGVVAGFVLSKLY